MSFLSKRAGGLWRRQWWVLWCALVLGGCAPGVPQHSAPPAAFDAASNLDAIAASPDTETEKASSSRGLNPGKVLLLAVGVFSALLVLLVIVDGR
jgi:hypothetical protein